MEEQGLFLQQNAADTLLRNTSSLQVLLSMGFQKKRALKALAATGDAGVQVACDWIFAHINDPTLDDETAREFIIYACPTGPFGSQLEEFWHRSLAACGRNGVHSSFPHVTLCSFFKCDDDKVAKLLHASTIACDRAMELPHPSKFEVEYFSSDNYVGLFLEDCAASFLRSLSDIFSEEAFNATGCKVESHKNKQLHITLAYKFPSNQLKELEDLAKQLNLNKPSTWEIRLYSKDPKYANCETLRVLYPYAPSADGHLQLINGDSIFVAPDDVSDKSGLDGWFFGTSWMTGCSGFFPASHTERSTDTDTWTLHKTYSLSSKSNNAVPATKISRRYSRGADEYHSTGYSSSHSLLHQDITAVSEHTKASLPTDSPPRPPPSIEGSETGSATSHTSQAPPRPPKDEVYSQVKKPKGIVAVSPKLVQTSRRIYIFRHAERVDVTFGKQWISLSFDEEGLYHRKNLNMPKKLPKRPGGPSDFCNDGPITEMGYQQAFLTGQALKHIGVRPTHVYSSPSLRCLQTASSILHGLELEKNTEINVDLSLYEWMKWSPGGLPHFMEADNLAEFGIVVSKSYNQKCSPEVLVRTERCTDYFNRCHKFISSVISETSGDILIVAHAGSLDGLSRQLQGLNPRSMPHFVGIVTKIPYCGSIVLEDFTEDVGVWQLVEPPYPALIHAPNPHFDWKTLNE